VDETKTEESRRKLPLDEYLLVRLKAWKQSTPFGGSVDWMFASPVQVGRLPWSYDQIWRVYQKAASKAGLDKVGTHCLRHTCRNWLDAVGTSLDVQKKMMRHSDIRTTMNIYVDVVTDDVRQAQDRITRLAFAVHEQSGSPTDRKLS